MIIRGINDFLDVLSVSPEGNASEKGPSFKTMFIHALGTAVVSEKNVSLQIFNLIEKLKANSDGDFELDDAEARLLAAVVDKNPGRWTAYYHAQVLRRIS